MRIDNIIVFLFAIISIFSRAQGASAQSSFQIYIGTEMNEWITSADNDEYGNCLLAGIMRSNSIPGKGLLLKVRPDGSYEQSITSLNDTSLSFVNVKTLGNGNYFVIARSNPFPGSDQNKMDVFIFDTCLNVITRKTYDLPIGYLKMWGYSSLLEDNDGNLVLATTLSYNQGYATFQDFVFYKFTQDGDTLLSRIYETWYGANVYSLSRVPDSDQLMIISQGYIPATAGELMFLDSNLNLIRVVRLRGGIGFDTKYWISNTSFIMSESYTKPNPDLTGEKMVRISIVDTTAEYIKSIELDHPDTMEYASYGESMSYYNDSTIYISSFQSHHDLTFSQPNYIYLYIVDTNLYVRGYKVLGGEHAYVSDGVIATLDGGSLIWSLRYNIPDNGNGDDIMIWKVMPEDMILYTRVSYLPPGRIQGHAWPNPVDDEIYISLEAFAQGETIRYRITDMQGRTCLYLKQIVTGNCLHTQTQNLEPGMYIYEITGQNNKTISGKFIKN